MHKLFHISMRMNQKKEKEAQVCSFTHVINMSANYIRIDIKLCHFLRIKTWPKPTGLWYNRSCKGPLEDTWLSLTWSRAHIKCRQGTPLQRGYYLQIQVFIVTKLSLKQENKWRPAFEHSCFWRWRGPFKQNRLSVPSVSASVFYRT